jgi:hypothetical protein
MKGSASLQKALAWLGDQRHLQREEAGRELLQAVEVLKEALGWSSSRRALSTPVQQWWSQRWRWAFLISELAMACCCVVAGAVMLMLGGSLTVCLPLLAFAVGVFIPDPWTQFTKLRIVDARVGQPPLLATGKTNGPDARLYEPLLPA